MKIGSNDVWVVSTGPSFVVSRRGAGPRSKVWVKIGQVGGCRQGLLLFVKLAGI